MGQIKLVVDAGHGGIDPGAVAKHGENVYREKDLCWDLATRIRRLADGDDRINVAVVPHEVKTLSPRGDRFKNRAAFGVKEKADVFVSIHWNSASNRKANGSETWFANADERGKYFAGQLVSDVAIAMASQQRGVHNETTNRHGRLGILHGHAKGTDVCLLEVGFVTSAADLERYRKHKDAVARAIIDAAVQMATLARID